MKTAVENPHLQMKYREQYLPAPVEQMLERKHGLFDSEALDYRFDGVNGDAAALCKLLKDRIAV